VIIHPQGDLAIFGYRPAMKVKNFIKILFISWICTCFELCVETWRFFLKKMISIFGNFKRGNTLDSIIRTIFNIFFEKIYSPNGKNWPQKRDPDW